MDLRCPAAREFFADKAVTLLSSCLALWGLPVGSRKTQGKGCIQAPPLGRPPHLTPVALAEGGQAGRAGEVWQEGCGGSWVGASSEMEETEL